MCCGENNCCWYLCLCTWLFLGIFLTVGGILLGDVVPDLQHHMEEERHHTSTTCRLLSTNITGERDCTYIEDCSEDCSREIRSTFDCSHVRVSFKYLNTTTFHAELFRSYQDALETDYECSAFECEDNHEINEYISNLEQKDTFNCFFHPDKFQFAYMNTSNLALIVFELICGILFITVPLIICVCSMFCAVCESKCPSCSVRLPCKKIRRDPRDFILKVYGNRANNRSTGNIVQCLRNGELQEIKKFLKRDEVNNEIRRNDIRLSPLAIAAQSGQVNIMTCLESIGANLKYVNSRRKRIFHFACESEKEEAIKWCIDRGLPINATDSLSETPLLTFLKTTRSPSASVLKLLINSGANANVIGDDNLSALHIAVENNKSWDIDTRRQVITLLIKSGCISHQNVNQLQHGSPFELLVQEKEYTLCALLIEAGYELDKDEALPYLIDLPQDVILKLREELWNPPPLKRLCRTKLRNFFGGIRVQQKIELLPLPTMLTHFLKLEGHYEHIVDINIE